MSADARSGKGSDAGRMRLSVVARQGRGAGAPSVAISPSLTPRWQSGRHPGPGRGCPPVIEATDVGDPMAPYGQDLPALDRSSSPASGRGASDFQPTRRVPAPAITSVTTAPAPAARALAHHAMTWSLSRQSASSGPSGAPQRALRSSRLLMASRSPDSRANLTRSVSAADSQKIPRWPLYVTRFRRRAGP